MSNEPLYPEPLPLLPWTLPTMPLFPQFVTDFVNREDTVPGKETPEGLEATRVFRKALRKRWGPYSSEDAGSDDDDVRSISTNEWHYGADAPRIWENETTLHAIPDLFTIDLVRSFGVHDPEVRAALCPSSCDGCEYWYEKAVTDMSRARFCVQTTENPSDFDFFKTHGVFTDLSWPRELEVAEDGTERKWNLIICIDCDEGGKHTAHVRLPCIFKSSEQEFSIRSLSSVAKDDALATKFSSLAGGIFPDFETNENWDRARALIAQCQASHEPCRLRDAATRAAGFFPRRLVDVGAEADEYIRLVSGEDVVGAEGYLALSYCWGDGAQQTHETTLANVEGRLRHDDALRLEDQPQTIVDAVKVTRAIGLTRLLWIDSLCIVQDDDAEKATEIARMDQIYQHAMLLISAARASGVDEGFLGPVNPREITHIEIQYSVPFRYRAAEGGEEQQGFVLLEKQEPKSAVDKEEPLHCRGWTWQENVLSKRILAFGRTGMRWQCLVATNLGDLKSSNSANEAEWLSRESYMACRGVLAPKIDNDLHRLLEWDRHRSAFWPRDLSNVEDRLPAFSAIPKQFIPAFGDEGDYIAGHWRAHLPRDLYWVGGGLGEATRDRYWPFPTWSWASSSYRGMDAPFPHTSQVGSQCKDTAAVIGVEVELVHAQNPFGDVRSATLTLAANTLPVAVKFKKDTENGIARSEDHVIDSATPITTGHSFTGHAAHAYTGFAYRLDAYYRDLDDAAFRYLEEASHCLLELMTPSTPFSKDSCGLILLQFTDETPNISDPESQFFRIGTYGPHITQPAEDEDSSSSTSGSNWLEQMTRTLSEALHTMEGGAPGDDEAGSEDEAASDEEAASDDEAASGDEAKSNDQAASDGEAANDNEAASDKKYLLTQGSFSYYSQMTVNLL